MVKKKKGRRHKLVSERNTGKTLQPYAHADSKKASAQKYIKRQYDTSNGGSEYQVFFWSLVGIVVNKKQGGSVVCL